MSQQERLRLAERRIIFHLCGHPPVKRAITNINKLPRQPTICVKEGKLDDNTMIVAI